MKYFHLFCTIGIFYSCTSVSIRDVKPAAAEVRCDTLDTVSFSNNILPIIAKNCNECHSSVNPESGISLSNYLQISREAKNGNLYGNITGAAGFEQMPPDGPPLPSCDIDKIKKWILNGSLNN